MMNTWQAMMIPEEGKTEEAERQLRDLDTSQHQFKENQTPNVGKNLRIDSEIPLAVLVVIALTSNGLPSGKISE